ncbi:hypothetical protein [Tunturibacter empetritectus]|jgi:hypothetical protein|uniref:Uncharacterized protein n=1 Tax=Tunturiibacter empetritectus TaxID=3069691 RepID=A0A7W8IGJ8_9BACT|nr:hypothetical protein [Edaphobacter lichenicola]MBB5316627.1 hypothetical protein [Edaphobacter lichenicola]
MTPLTPAQMTTSTPAAGNHAHPYRHSVPTLAAIGFLAYYVVVMCHEVLGHGVAFRMLGAHHFVLTSTSIDSSDMLAAFAPGRLGYRFINAAGSLSTILLGILLYPLLILAMRKRANITLRIFLWLVVAVGIFHGFCYIIYSGLAGVGDWKEVIAFWPHQTLLRVLEIVFGTLICTGVVRFFAALFSTFPESLTRLALVPYAAATFIFCLAGLRIPNGRYLMLISVLPASLMGQAILLFVAPVARRLRKESAPEEVVPISPTALFFAALFIVIIFLTAPGVHFMMP